MNIFYRFSSKMPNITSIDFCLVNCQLSVTLITADDIAVVLFCWCFVVCNLFCLQYFEKQYVVQTEYFFELWIKMSSDIWMDLIPPYCCACSKPGAAWISNVVCPVLIMCLGHRDEMWLFVNISRSIPHSWLITGFVTSGEGNAYPAGSLGLMLLDL